MGVESATCLSPQGELSRVPPATEHRRGARRAPTLEAPGPAPRAPRGARSRKPSLARNPRQPPFRHSLPLLPTIRKRCLTTFR